jgi:hypothetical protein
MKKLSLLTLAIAFAIYGVNAQQLSQIGQPINSQNSQQDVLLRLNLKKGQIFKQEINTKMNVKMEAQGMKIDTDAPFLAAVSYYVLDVQNKNFVFEVSYDMMRIKMNVMGKDFSFDSENPNESSPLNIFANIIGKKFQLTLDEMGNLIKIDGLAKILETMFDGKNMSKEQKNQAQILIKSVLSEEKIKEITSSNSIILPKAPVKNGFEWTAEQKQHIVGLNVLALNKFKVEKITDKEIVISSVSDYKIEGGLEQGDATTEILMKKSSVQGVYIIDLATGWTKEHKSNISLIMTVITKNGEKVLSMPMEIVAETHVQTR